MRGDTPPVRDIPSCLVQGRPLFHEVELVTLLLHIRVIQDQCLSVDGLH